jgi:hypothetical protein
VLIDTSILVRTLQPHHPFCSAANKAIDWLRLEGHPLHLVPQNFMELWVVATRPVDQNGLGMSVADVLTEFARLKSFSLSCPKRRMYTRHGSDWFPPTGNRQART